MDRREEALAVQMAHIEELLERVTAEIHGTRQAAEKGLAAIDRRVSMLEVNVRALEDRDVRRRAIEEERVRTARENRESATVERQEIRAAQDRQLTKRHFWAGVAIASMATLLSALIAAHVLF